MRETTIRNFPDDLPSRSRRTFLKGVLGTAAAGVVLPGCGIERRKAGLETPSLAEAVSRVGETEIGDESFWQAVKNQFSLREDMVLLNAANLCPSPLSVRKRVFDLTEDVDSDASFANRAKFADLKEASRVALAGYLGARPEEIAIVRNTSEGNNTVISGLDLGPGDEVVIWDQNHPTANVAWDVRAERYGYTVRRITTPENPLNSKELVEAFTDAFTPRTRVVCFSHVSNVTGVRIDAQILCAAARSAGILSLVDGAQTFGTYPLALGNMGCDFFTGSSHKWFFGPKEVGILYVREGTAEHLQPLHVGVGWETARTSGARRFETLGQQDDSRIAAMKDAVELHTLVGSLRISTRARMLADAVREGLRREVPGVRFITPIPHPLSWGVIVFNVPGLDTSGALNTLYEDHAVGCAVMGENIRYSPHIYNTLEDIDRGVLAIRRMLI